MFGVTARSNPLLPFMILSGLLSTLTRPRRSLWLLLPPPSRLLDPPPPSYWSRDLPLRRAVSDEEDFIQPWLKGRHSTEMNRRNITLRFSLRNFICVVTLGEAKVWPWNKWPRNKHHLPLLLRGQKLLVHFGGVSIYARKTTMTVEEKKGKNIWKLDSVLFCTTLRSCQFWTKTESFAGKRENKEVEDLAESPSLDLSKKKRKRPRKVSRNTRRLTIEPRYFF